MADLVAFLRTRLDEVQAGVDSLGRPLTVHIDQDVPEQPACLGCNFDNDEEYRYAVDECPTKRLLALPYRDHPDYSDWAVNRSERGGDAMEVCPQCGSWIATAKKPQHSEWHVGVD